MIIAQHHLNPQQYLFNLIFKNCLILSYHSIRQSSGIYYKFASHSKTYFSINECNLISPILLIKVMNYSIKSESKQVNSTNLFCFICEDFFSKPYTTACGHTFCYMCLEQYLLYADIAIKICPKCSQNIKGKPINPVSCLSEFIENIVKKDKNEYERLTARNEMAKDRQKHKQLKGIKVGMLLDIRDSNHIWCQGMVVRIITRLDEPVKYLRINYINYLQKKEEDIPLDSDRLASKGFYTARKDIPHYASKSTSPIIKKYQI